MANLAAAFTPTALLIVLLTALLSVGAQPVNIAKVPPFTNPKSPPLWRAPGPDAALQRALRARPRRARDATWEAMRDLQGFLVELEKGIAGDNNKTAGNVETATCNGLSAWGANARRYMEERGIVGAVDDCVTLRTRGPELRKLQTALEGAGAEFRTGSGAGWGEQHPIGLFAFNTTDHKCTLRRQAALRVRAGWFLQVAVTNAALTGAGSAEPRETLAEHVRADVARGRFASLGFFLPPRQNGTGRVLAATEVMNGPGPPPAGGLFGAPELEENPALRDALVLADDDAEQADDAVQPSNVAILGLPLLMSLVPAALFADVNALGLFVYAGLTDVLTAVPLAIKGWELLSIDRNEHPAGAAFYSGVPGVANHSVAEVFIARCVPAQGRSRTAVTFLAVALVATLFGIGFEFLARKYMRRRRPYTPGMHPPLGPAAAGLLQQNVSAVARYAPHGSTSLLPRDPAPLHGCGCSCHAHNHPHAHFRTAQLAQLTHRPRFPPDCDFPLLPHDRYIIPPERVEYTGDYDFRPRLAPPGQNGHNAPASSFDYFANYDARPQMNLGGAGRPSDPDPTP